MPLVEQGGVGQGLGEAPVQGHAAGLHLAAILVDLGDLTLHLNPVGDLAHAGGQALQALHLHRGVGISGPLVAEVGLPVDEQRGVGLLHQGVGHMVAGQQVLAVGLDHRLGLLFGEHALLDQALGVDLAGRGMILDLAVHQRLGTARLVGLVVAATTVADQVDHHVLLELLTEVDRHLGRVQHRVRVVPVDVEDRRLDHLGDVGAVLGGARILRVGGSEAHLVVDHDMDGAAGLVGAGLGHLECLHDHALAGEGGVAVDADRQDLGAVPVVAAILAGAHRALDHRGDDLQVGGVEGQRQVHLASRAHHIGAEALVVLDVAGAALDDLLAIELVDQVAGVLAEDVDQQVEAAPVGHADHDLLDAVAAAALDQLVHHRNEGLAALEAEALGARVLGGQVVLQALGGGQPLQHVLAHLVAELRRAAHRLEALLQPALLLGIDDMHDLAADGAAVGLLQRLDDIAQRRLVQPQEEGAGLELGIEILLSELVEGEVEVGNGKLAAQAQRIDVGLLVTAEAVGVDQLEDLDLLAALLAIGCGGSQCRSALLGELVELFADRGQGNIVGGAVVGARQLVKILAPLVGNGGGVIEVLLVERFHVMDVAATDV